MDPKAPPGSPTHGRVARAAAAVAALGASLSLVGWALDVPALRSVLPRLPDMAPNTAVGLLLAAGALWLLCVSAEGTPRRGVRLGGAVASAAIAALGIITLAERLLGWDAGIDRVLFAETIRRAGASPMYGRMAPNTAACFVLLGAALLALGVGARAERRPWALRAAVVLATLVAVIASVAIAGYAFGAGSLYAVPEYAIMALNTAVAFALLAVGILFAHPDAGLAAVLSGDDAGAVMARRLLPVALATPVAVGLVRQLGEDARLYPSAFGTGARTVVEMGLLVWLVVWTARRLRMLDAERAMRFGQERRARAEATRLAQSLEAANRELVGLAATAEAANRAKSDFLAVMSHELRTPLNAILGYVQLMEMGLHGPVTDAQKTALAKVGQNQARLLALVNDVLDYAKLESGQIRLAAREVPAREVLDGVEASILPQARAKGIAYECCPGCGQVAMRADPERVQQILVNLLSNAVKFTEPGGSVAVWCEPLGRRVAIHVRDTGRGIPPDKLEAIFEPFVQVDQGLTRSAEGTGLGLAISRDLARAMGGDLTAESDAGKGSTFTLLLPTAIETGFRTRAAFPAAAQESRPYGHSTIT